MSKIEERKIYGGRVFLYVQMNFGSESVLLISG